MPWAGVQRTDATRDNFFVQELDLTKAPAASRAESVHRILGTEAGPLRSAPGSLPRCPSRFGGATRLLVNDAAPEKRGDGLAALTILGSSPLVAPRCCSLKAQGARPREGLPLLWSC